MATSKPKIHQTFLTEPELAVTLAVLNAMRKSRTDNAIEMDKTDLDEVLEALHVAGHCVVACGALDQLRRMLNDIEIKRDKIIGARLKKGANDE